jgi:hypothetical protein
MRASLGSNPDSGRHSESLYTDGNHKQMQERSETKTYSREELDQLCYPTFERLYQELGERYKDWIVAIEPESGDYFIGLDDYEVLNRARKKHPRSQFFAYRLSENPAADTLC